MNKKAIALISGGLDSLLAARVVMEQGVDVVGVAFVMPFASRNVRRFKEYVREAAADAGIPVRFVDISKEFLEVLKAPRHGYGANLNPCIDCKILMLSLAKKIMREEDAGFVITGEVLGERPMSQRRDALDVIRKRSSLEGLLLRPLSAGFLEETLPEKEGIIDREKLPGIKGRSRKVQLELAEKYNIRKFFAPAGGCLLTDPIFSRKLRDLMDKDSLNDDDIALLKYGRHFRLGDGTKVVVGRNEKENEKLLHLKKESDVMLRLKEAPGPYVLVRGKPGEANTEKAAALAVSFSRSRDSGGADVEFWADENGRKSLRAKAMGRDRIEELRV